MEQYLNSPYSIYTEARRGQGLTHVAIHITNEGYVLQRILNNTKSLNNYLKIKPLDILVYELIFKASIK